MGKKLRQRARRRVMVDHLLSGTSGSIALLERRALRTQAAAHQYRDVLYHFMTICLEKSLLLTTPAAGRQCSGDLLQSIAQGWGVASRGHQTVCIVSASLPTVLTCRYSSSPAHDTGSQRVEKSHAKAKQTNHIRWSSGKLCHWT